MFREGGVVEEEATREVLEIGHTWAVMWLGVPVLAGRTRGPAPYYADLPRERETTRSEPESGLRTRGAEKTSRYIASCRRAGNGRQVRPYTQTRTWATRCSFASHAVIMVFGITTVPDDGKLTMSSRKDIVLKRVKTPMKTCLMFLDRNGNLAHLKFIWINMRANRTRRRPFIIVRRHLVYLYEFLYSHEVAIWNCWTAMITVEVRYRQKSTISLIKGGLRLNRMRLLRK